MGWGGFCVNRPFVWFLLCSAVSGTLRGLLCWLKKFKYVKNKISENFQKFFNFYEIFIMRNVQIYFMNKMKNMQKSQNTENAKNSGFWAKNCKIRPILTEKIAKSGGFLRILRCF